MSKHTPGPWYVNSTIEHEPGKPRRAVHNVFNQHGLYAHIAECGNAANARLIAAAPELLELLTQAERCIAAAVRIEQTAPDEPPCPVSEWDYEADQLAADIRTAIAKATGAQP